MFSFLSKKIKAAVFQAASEKEAAKENDEMEEPRDIPTKISDFIDMIKAETGNSGDIIFREFTINDSKKTKAAIVFVDGLTKTEQINESIIKPIMWREEKEIDLNLLRDGIVCTAEVAKVDTKKEMYSKFFGGDSILFVDGFSQCLTISTRGWEKRAVAEPLSESVTRGPREGFTEDFRTNISLIRRKIKSGTLRVDYLNVGQRSATAVALIYLSDVADPETVKEVTQKISKINIDAILESGYIEQFIETSNFSIFSTVGNTEKPDVATGKILEGRIAVVIDGTPFVLTVPQVFAENFQTSEDYYGRTIYASFIRILHYAAFALTILAPSLYVAMTTFHQEMIPTTLLFTMIKAREGIPYPAIFEAFILLIIFEILREAGLRLPRPIGPTVSIVGALVMGDAAVSAGIVGAPMLIVIAITAVSGFVVPQLADASAVLRVLLLIMTGIFGGYGLVLGIILLFIHLGSLKSFGVDYMSPIAPMNIESLKDLFIRAPIPKMKTRPSMIAKGNIKRQGE